MHVNHHKTTRNFVPGYCKFEVLLTFTVEISCLLDCETVWFEGQVFPKRRQDIYEATERHIPEYCYFLSRVTLILTSFWLLFFRF
jgi:hypothetical protein